MKLLYTLLFLFSFIYGQSQILIQDEKEEEVFFEFLELSITSNLQVNSYIELKSDKNERLRLIRLIDGYVNAWRSFKIFPTYSDGGNHSNGVYVGTILTDLCYLFEEQSSFEVEQSLAELSHSFTLESLYQEYQNNYVSRCEENVSYCTSRFTHEQNLKVISTRIGIVDANEYCFYESYYGKANALKGFEFEHGNDVFMLFGGKNQDREMTGSFKFIFITDNFKWRWLRLSNNSERVLAYQTISIGGAGYTPYIRYRNNYELADTVHVNDRPFGSYFYIERSKHRTFRKGLVRQRGDFQIGSIGISQGRKIQGLLHRDVIYDSQFVYGWDNQIGNGGRLFLQINQKVDLLLFSNTNEYHTVFRSRTHTDYNKRKYAGINIMGEAEVNLGGINTSAQIGIRYSTLDFLNQSGNNQINSKPNSKNEFGWKFDFGLAYRYVKHNTMLEGLGYWNTFPIDEYDSDNPDYYVLSANQIERNLIILDFGINLRFRKTTVFFRQRYHTLEYQSPLIEFDWDNPKVLSKINPDDLDYYQNTIVKENQEFIGSSWFGGKSFYGFGTIGVSWFID